MRGLCGGLYAILIKGLLGSILGVLAMACMVWLKFESLFLGKPWACMNQESSSKQAEGIWVRPDSPSMVDSTVPCQFSSGNCVRATMLPSRRKTHDMEARRCSGLIPMILILNHGPFLLIVTGQELVLHHALM